LTTAHDRTTRDASFRVRALFVTHDADITRGLEELLTADGINLVRVDRVNEAVREARRSEFTVVAVDVAQMAEAGLASLRGLLPNATHVALAGDEFVHLPDNPEVVSGVMRVGLSVPSEESLESLGRAQLLYEARKAPSMVSALPSATTTAQTEVLLVEDNGDDAEMIEAVLQRSGIEHVGITRVSRMDRAVELLTVRDFALIMTDLTLPDARGVDSVVALRRAAPATPIVVMSGVADDVTAMQAVEQGAQEYVLKGDLSVDALRRTLRYAVGRKALEERLQFQAHHDPLTGLANRALFHDRVEHAIAKAKRTRERLAILFVDLDRFKQVNDTLGHDAGDAVLRVVSERMSACVRDADTLARIGGDEFAVLAETLSSQAAAIQVAERIVESLAQPCAVGVDRSVAIGASVGIAFFPDDGQTAEILVRHADIAMYRAKRRGQGGYVCYGEQTENELQTVQAFEDQLVRAFRLRQLDVVRYELSSTANQPRRWLLTPSWQPAGGAPITLGTLNRLLESAGLDDEVARWMFGVACRTAQALKEPVMVRIGPGQFQDARFSEELARGAEASGLSDGALVVLVNQAELAASPERANAEIERLGRSGIQVFVSEFGAFGADIDLLRQVPALRGVVLNQEWCEQLAAAPEGMAFLRALTGLCHVRSLGVYAPPSPVPAAWYSEAGCDGHFPGPALVVSTS